MTGPSAAASTSAVMTETVAGRREGRIAIFSQVRTKDRCALTIPLYGGKNGPAIARIRGDQPPRIRSSDRSLACRGPLRRTTVRERKKFRAGRKTPWCGEIVGNRRVERWAREGGACNEKAAPTAGQCAAEPPVVTNMDATIYAKITGAFPATVCLAVACYRAVTVPADCGWPCDAGAKTLDQAPAPPQKTVCPCLPCLLRLIC
jgi:hypothetical protein